MPDLGAGAGAALTEAGSDFAAGLATGAGFELARVAGLAGTVGATLAGVGAGFGAGAGAGAVLAAGATGAPLFFVAGGEAWTGAAWGFNAGLGAGAGGGLVAGAAGAVRTVVVVFVFFTVRVFVGDLTRPGSLVWSTACWGFSAGAAWGFKPGTGAAGGGSALPLARAGTLGWPGVVAFPSARAAFILGDGLSAAGTTSALRSGVAGAGVGGAGPTGLAVLKGRASLTVGAALGASPVGGEGGDKAALAPGLAVVRESFLPVLMRIVWRLASLLSMANGLNLSIESDRGNAKFCTLFCAPSPIPTPRTCDRPKRTVCPRLWLKDHEPCCPGRRDAGPTLVRSSDFSIASQDGQ